MQSYLHYINWELFGEYFKNKNKTKMKGQQPGIECNECKAKDVRNLDL